MTTPGSQASMYQGYPYVNPTVIDAPSIDAETAAKWSNLPRKQVVPKQPLTNEPIVYIDIPDSGTSGSSSCTTESSRPAAVAGSASGAAASKVDPDDTPVVYIDLPESTTSVTSDNERRRGDTASGHNNSGFVEETIFYDPFKNRRIDVVQNRESPAPGSSSGQAGPSSLISSQYVSKESFVYGSQSSQVNSRPSTVGDYLIPVNEFPNPPPAYSEVDTSPAPTPTRTEVIVPNQQMPIGIASSDRKLVSCPHCNVRVHTLVVRENACLTHAIAIIFLLVFFPIGILIYCTNYFKYRNHYCPNCNLLIGYEIPIFCQGMTYTKTD
ncbi:mucin-17-like [Nymphalis io]|uniref:mucin-17-like n=1 Tax=Inachis io TaxID=171585 RepID=UPI002166D542|nr:mucin-17-like [Nymphalis io]